MSRGSSKGTSEYDWQEMLQDGQVYHTEMPLVNKKLSPKYSHLNVEK